MVVVDKVVDFCICFFFVLKYNQLNLKHFLKFIMLMLSIEENLLEMNCLSELCAL